ncbi:MAG: hypothetical protein ACLR0U_32130 [Enterocloster clostridioformis]
MEDIIYVYKQQKYSVIAAKSRGDSCSENHWPRYWRSWTIQAVFSWWNRLYREPVSCGETRGEQIYLTMVAFRSAGTAL